MRGVFLLVVVGACSDPEKPPPITDSDASAPPVVHPGAPTCSFGTTSLALPAMLGAQTPPLPLLEGQTKCATSNGSLDWFLADFDENGFVDLAVTLSCDDASVGASRWLVYPGSTTGFGAALSYAIPQIEPGCAAFGLADIDADGALDLVVTSLCNDASVGTSRWLVYRNVGGTFATTATTFALPSGAATGAFDSMERDAADCANGKPAFAFFDVTGDAFADLVVTTACDDFTVGVTQWRVYPGSSSGLGAATSFPLPGGGTFASPLSGTMSCTSTPQAFGYTLADFDGDRKVDIVVTQRCSDPAIGTSAWNVYANRGTQFATSPNVVLLPDFAGEASPAFPIASGATSCASGTLRWALDDVDGDFKPDLVVTETCTTAPLAAGDWLVFPNTGTSFGDSKTFAVPPPLGTPTSLESALSCSGLTQVPAFQATHFFGDELDLVETQSCTDTTVGASRWLVYRPICPN
jgi:hypothetical protein